MKNKTLVVFVLAMAILSLPMCSVIATKPVSITASRTRDTSSGDPPESRMAGKSDNRFTIVTGTIFEWTGDIEGNSTQDAIRFYPNYDPDLKPSQWLPTRVHAVCTFESATVMGKSGGLTMKLQFVIDEEKNFKGNWVIIGGTDDLANLHGQGKVSGPKGAEVFSGMLHFDS